MDPDRTELSAVIQGLLCEVAEAKSQSDVAQRVRDDAKTEAQRYIGQLTKRLAELGVEGVGESVRVLRGGVIYMKNEKSADGSYAAWTRPPRVEDWPTIVLDLPGILAQYKARLREDEKRADTEAEQAKSTAATMRLLVGGEPR